MGYALICVLIISLIILICRPKKREEYEEIENGLVKTTTYYQWNRNIPKVNNQEEDWQKKREEFLKKYSATEYV